MSTELTAVRGDTFTRTITFKDSAGTAYDITLWTIWFTIKNSTDDTDAEAIIQKKITAHSDPTNGTSIISLTAAETDVITPGTYRYDIQIKKDDGTIYTVVPTASIQFTADTTRSVT